MEKLDYFQSLLLLRQCETLLEGLVHNSVSNILDGKKVNKLYDSIVYFLEHVEGDMEYQLQEEAPIPLLVVKQQVKELLDYLDEDEYAYSYLQTIGTTIDHVMNEYDFDFKNKVTNPYSIKKNDNDGCWICEAKITEND